MLRKEMVPSPSKKNSGLVNPRWRVYTYRMMKEVFEVWDTKMDKFI